MNSRFLLLAILLLPSFASAQAGRFILAVGDVLVMRGAAEIRAGAGTPVEAGDTIRVGPNSNAQVRFSDESIVGLRPGTVFRLDEYSYSGQNDGQEKTLISLLKGGFRTITGAIGRLQSRERYAVRTTTATVGIRGTHYTLLHCDNDCEAGPTASGGQTAPGAGVPNGTYGGVSDGRIAIENKTGERVFGANEFFFVAGADSAPQSLIGPPPFLYDRLSSQSRNQGQKGQETSESMAQSGMNAESRPSEVPSAPAPEPFVVTEQRNQSGSPAVVGDTGHAMQPAPGAPGFSGTPGFSGAVTGLAALSSVGVGEFANIVECDDPGFCSGGATITFDSGGYKRLDCGSFCFIDRNAATNIEVGSVAGVIEWGRWTGGPIQAGGFYEGLTFGPNQGFHYVVGVPASPMPLSGTGTFTLLGATTPTFSDGTGGGLGAGSMTGGSASVNFLTGSISASMQLAFNGGSGINNYSLTMASGAFSPGSTGISGSGTMAHTGGTLNVCGTSCPAQFVGFFAGSNASHVGLGYNANASSFSVNGVAVMKR
jgi:hypothetical protein